jgi:hypothetical protein
MGTVVAGLGAGGLSLMVGMPETPAARSPDVVAQTVPTAEPTKTEPETAAQADTVSTPDLTPVTDPAPADDMAAEPADEAVAMAEPAKPGRRPQAEQGVALPDQPAPQPDQPAAPADVGADTAPLAVPQLGAEPTAPEASPEGQGAQVAVNTDAPVLPTAQAQIPDVSVPEDELSISTNPAQPPLPPLPLEDSALLPAEPEMAQDSLAEETGPASPVVETAPAPDQVPAAALAEQPEPVEAPASAETPTSSETPTPAPVLPEITDNISDAEESPTRVAIGTPAGTLTERAPAVPQGRLPSIGADTAPDAPAPMAGKSDSPLQRFAADRPDVAADLPRMAVVLIDDGTGPLGPQALDPFPFPLSFAISPDHPDAAAAARAYRALGYDVLALADLPSGATASDVETLLPAVIDSVPEAVAVLGGPLTGLQGSRAVSDQVTAVLAETGHGLVMQPKGLNTAQQLAAKAGVASATVFRDFDGQGQDTVVIRRFLDQAAFRARQEGAVIMLGRLRADTISALVLWGLQDRAASVALVPVSTVLLEGQGG